MGWIEAGDLTVDTAVQKADGTYGRIQHIEMVVHPQPMYDLTVDVAHTFFVGDEQWLVHNCGNNSNGAYTEPQLPPKVIVNENGVNIHHNYKRGDHGPPHLHVSGNGPNTRIGQNGHPIANNPELSTTQRQVVNNNIATIRQAIDSIGRWYRFWNR